MCVFVYYCCCLFTFVMFYCRYWSPGPRARPLPDMKYIVYGFAYLQDMIEHGLIREHSGFDDIGIVVQEFPYPCYISDR